MFDEELLIKIILVDSVLQSLISSLTVDKSNISIFNVPKYTQQKKIILKYLLNSMLLCINQSMEKNFKIKFKIR